MMAVYRQLTENTNYTRDASKNVLDELVKLTDLVLLYKSRLEQVERDNKDLEGKLNLLAGQYKVHAERLNKLEKLK
jgi:predicted nuclease with TOPRIM domain